MLIKRWATLAVVLGSTIVLAVAPGGVAASPPRQSQVGATVMGQLRNILANEAFVTGDRHPADMRMVETTAAGATKVLSPGSPSNSLSPGTQPDEPVYLVAASGHFVYRDGLASPSSRAQRGTTLFVVLAQSNEAVVVWG